MRFILLSFLIPIASVTGFGQGIVDQSKTIEIQARAEVKVIPDEIYLSFALEEKVKNKQTIGVEKLELQLVDSLKAHSIDTDNLFVGDAGAQYRQRSKKGGYKANVNYTLKLETISQVYEVFDVLDNLGINGAYVSKVDHSKSQDFRKQVKINAMKNAKEQGVYMTEAIGEKLGEAIKIFPNSVTIRGFYMDDNMISNNSYSYASESKSVASRRTQVNFEKLTYTYTVKVIFKLD